VSGDPGVQVPKLGLALGEHAGDRVERLRCGQQRLDERFTLPLLNDPVANVRCAAIDLLVRVEKGDAARALARNRSEVGLSGCA
jgi:hypothetical protein